MRLDSRRQPRQARLPLWGTVFTFCGRGLAGQCATIREWLVAVRSQRQPAFGVGIESDLMQSVRRRFENFLVYSPPVVAGAQAERLVGKPAIDKIVVVLQARFAEPPPEGPSPTLADIRPLHTFGWLCDDAQAVLAKEWTDQILRDVGVGQGAAQMQNAPPAKKQNTEKKGKAKDSEGLVDAYFS